MLEVLILVAMAASQTGSPNVQFRAEAVVSGGQITLGDVADLSGLPKEIASRASELELASFPKAAADMTFTQAELSSRARARLPILVAWLPGNVDGAVRVRRKFSNVAGLHPFVVADGGVSVGANLVARLSAGIISIERKAIALQAAKPGEAFFVRTVDGDVLRVMCRGED